MEEGLGEGDCVRLETPGTGDGERFGDGCSEQDFGQLSRPVFSEDIRVDGHEDVDNC